MKHFYSLISFMLLISLLGYNNILKAQSKISPRLQSKITTAEEAKSYAVWIFFTDKGKNTNAKLRLAEQTLPPNARKRRLKNMKGKSIINVEDIPVKAEYVENLKIAPNNIRYQSAWLNAVSAKISSQKIKEIEHLPFVKKIDLIGVAKKSPIAKGNGKSKKAVQATASKNIFNYGNSFTQMNQINVPPAHDLGFTGEGIIVCILDGGFNNLEHPVFASLNVIGAYDFVNNDDDVDDGDDLGVGDHGTATLSALAGFQEGHLIGPAFGANYILAKTENSEDEYEAEEDYWVAAMEWAESTYGPDVSTSSLGYPDWYNTEDLDGNTATITIAADYAVSIGILVLNSAGNNGGGTTTISAPADGDSVLTIGAVDSQGVRTYFSSVGPTADGRIKPDIMAMGEDVVVAEPDSQEFTTANGTSFSCPIAAGAATLLLQMCPEATNMEIYEALRETASRKDNPDNNYGKGIMDLMAAYKYLIPHIEHDSLSDTEDTSGPYTIEAIVSSYYDLLTNTPILHYRFNNGEWQTLIMQNTTGNTYSADIPSNGQDGTFDYYISVENIHRVVYLPQNAPTSFFSFAVGVDNQAPTIMHSPLKEYYINLWEQAKVICSLTDNININLQNCKIEWKINGVAQEDLPFYAQGDNNVFYANFSNIETEINDFIEYRIIAQDMAQTPNTSTMPENGYIGFYITEVIGFEQNAFSHNWVFNNASWQIDNIGAENSDYSAKSAEIANEEQSSISIDINTKETGEVSFYKKVSCETSYDFFQFFIDDIKQNEWTGEIDWSQEIYPLSMGEHTLSWVYAKDWVNAEGEDCAWIDMISLPKGSDYSIPYNIYSETSLTISPNPVDDILNFTLNTAENHSYKCSIYNSNGKIVKTEHSTSQIYVKNLPKGLYFIQIETNKGLITKKFVKQ